ncbi:MAG: cold-shock protein [Gammaproteobacteria bacterium]|nr:cold-shock protein [Gammaproteobacteria bacterium]HAN81285.1 cold-shock protein [Gammaproteobacteria bacterium]|tara:strand:- start:539 stop:748 length:210 start_codon:yes stop_codon:yes gene_type:complete
MQTGKVKWFNETKGFGFIVPDEGGDDAFVHITAVKENGIERLEDNQRVEFDLAEGRNGKMSVKTLKLID